LSRRTERPEPLRITAAKLAATIAVWMTAPRVLVLQEPMSLSLVEFPVPTVAVKLEDDSAVRIGLPAIEPAV
jgi:hypothetical protein